MIIRNVFDIKKYGYKEYIMCRIKFAHIKHTPKYLFLSYFQFLKKRELSKRPHWYTPFVVYTDKYSLIANTKWKTLIISGRKAHISFVCCFNYFLLDENTRDWTRVFSLRSTKTMSNKCHHSRDNPLYNRLATHRGILQLKAVNDPLEIWKTYSWVFPPCRNQKRHFFGRIHRLGWKLGHNKKMERCPTKGINWQSKLRGQLAD